VTKKKIKNHGLRGKMATSGDIKDGAMNYFQLGKHQKKTKNHPGALLKGLKNLG